MAVGKMKSAVRVNTFTMNILCDILYTSHMMVRKLCCLGGIDDTVVKRLWSRLEWKLKFLNIGVLPLIFKRYHLGNTVQPVLFAIQNVCFLRLDNCVGGLILLSLNCNLCDVDIMFCSCEGGSSTRQACPAGTYSAGDAESSSSACTVGHTSIIPQAIGCIVTHLYCYS